MGTFVALYVLAGIITGAYCVTVAQSKGYNQVVWFVGGFFFNFAALIAIPGMPLVTDDSYFKKHPTTSP